MDYPNAKNGGNAHHAIKEKRKKEAHECGDFLCSSCDKYVMDDHKCYLRSTPPMEDFKPRFIFFECSQDKRAKCEEGYKSLRKENCL